MNYIIALSPDLGLSAQEFARIWNDTPSCRDAGEVKIETSSSGHYDPGLFADAMAVLGPVGVGLATNALYDLIKLVFAQKDIHRQDIRKKIEIIHHTQPDGTSVLVVTIDEKG